MAQQQIQKQKTVKRMDVAVAEQEAVEHEETLSRARRARKHAHRATSLAMDLVDQINRVV